MREAIRHHLTVRKLVRDRRQAEDDFSLKITGAKERKAREDELALIYADWDDARNMFDDHLAQVRSRFLMNEADRLLLPKPELDFDGPDWQRSIFTGLVQLTPRALNTLQDAVRQERKARSEWWFQWAAAATGVLGTLIGLVAIFMR